MTGRRTDNERLDRATVVDINGATNIVCRSVDKPFPDDSRQNCIVCFADNFIA